MRAIYSGVDLMPVETHEFLAEAVYDDSFTDYLYTKYSFVATALVNGQVQVANGPFMSYDFKDQGPSVLVPGPSRSPVTPRIPNPRLSPPPEAGIVRGLANKLPRDIRFGPATPFTSHETVRHRLETPRGQLYIFSGPGMETGTPPAGTLLPPPRAEDLLLVSPESDRSCDCKNGPTPRVFGITMAAGDANTIVVDWGVETYVNEAGLNNASPMGALLSNRFRQRHGVDDSGYTSITTTGLAVFRTDLVYGDPQSPDSNRAVLFMPIPFGFRRVVDYVEGRPDVSGIEYQYTDIQVPVNFVAGPYAKAATMVAYHSQSVNTNIDPLKASLDLVSRAQSIILNNLWIKQAVRGEGGRGRPGRGRVGPGEPARPEGEGR